MTNDRTKLDGRVKTSLQDNIWLRESRLHYQSRLERRVKFSWRDKPGWKISACVTSHDWKKELGLHGKTGLGGRVKTSWHVNFGWKNQVYMTRQYWMENQDFITSQDWMEESFLHDKIGGKNRYPPPPPKNNPPCFPTGYDLNDLDQVRLGCTKVWSAQYWKTWYQFNPPYFPKLKWIHFSLQSPPPLRQHTLLFLFCDDRVICKWILIEPGTVL